MQQFQSPNSPNHHSYFSKDNLKKQQTELLGLQKKCITEHRNKKMDAHLKVLLILFKQISNEARKEQSRLNKKAKPALTRTSISTKMTS